MVCFCKIFCKVPWIHNNWIQVPQTPPKTNQGPHKMPEKFHKKKKKLEKKRAWCQRQTNSTTEAACILTTQNKYVDELNNMILNLHPGQAHEYLSADYFAADSQAEANYPVEVLNTIIQAGFPPLPEQFLSL